MIRPKDGGRPALITRIGTSNESVKISFIRVISVLFLFWLSLAQLRVLLL